MDVMNLVAKLSLDKTNFDNGIKGAQSSASGLGKSFNVPLGNISSKFTTLGTTLGTVGKKIGSFGKSFAPVSAGAGALIAATGALAIKAAGTGDRIDKMSQKVGLSRKSFQEMDFVMSQSGANIESLQTGMKTLTKQMSGAATGSKSSAEAFKKLGVSVTNSDGSLRNQEDVMWDTIKALQGMDNQTEKAKIASQLFGRAGTELMPLLNQEAGSLDKLRKKANDLGLVMSDDAVDASVKFTDTMDQLKRALAMAGAKIGAALLPHIQKFANYVIKNIPKIQNVIKGVADKIASLSPTVLKVIGVGMLAITAIAPVAGVIASIVTVVGGLATAIGFLLTPMGLVVVAIGAVIAIGVLLYKNWDKVKATAITLMNNLKTSFDQIRQAILNAWNAVKRATTNAWNAVKNAVTNAWKNIKTTVSNAINAVRTTITNIWNSIKSITGNVWSSIKETIGNAINAVKSTISNIWNSIKSITGNVWSSIKETIGNAINGAKDAVHNAVSAVKEFLKFTGISTIVKNVFNNIRNFIKDPINTAKNAVKTAYDNIKKWLPFSGLAKTVSNTFNSIKKAISDPINTAKGAVEGAVKTIKGLFPLKLGKIFNLSLPKFEIISKGSFPWGLGGKGSLPKWKVSWKKKGMNNLLALDGATIFGAMGGNLLGGGEAGRELVVGEKYAMDMIRKASNNENIEVLLVQLIGLLERWLPTKTIAYVNKNDISQSVNRELGKLLV